MKAFTITGIVFLLLATGCTVRKTVVNIIDVRKTHDPEPGLTDHKNHDLIVRREISEADKHHPQADEYTVYFFRMENDTIRRYQGSWEAKDDLNKASYKWLADTLASVRLYSSTSKKKMEFQVFGKHNPDGTKTSGMSYNEK